MVIVSMTINCIIGTIIESISTNQPKYPNLYHCGAWFVNCDVAALKTIIDTQYSSFAIYLILSPCITPTYVHYCNECLWPVSFCTMIASSIFSAGKPSSQRKISQISAIWIVSVLMNCIVEINIASIAMIRCNDENLYHFDAVTNTQNSSTFTLLILLSYIISIYFSNFDIIMSILCVYSLASGITSCQTIQTLFKLIFYSLFYLAVDGRTIGES